LYIEDLLRIIFFDDENALSAAVRPGTSGAPTTDKVVIQRIIEPLVYTQPLEADLDASIERDIERKNILFVLNALTQRMLPSAWNKPGNDVQLRRTTNFFYQGSIGWWMNEVLLGALRYALVRLDNKKPLLTEEMTEEQAARVLSIVDALCNWSIWSTTDAEDLKAMRSNTTANVAHRFSGYDSTKLLKDAGVV